MEFFNQPINFSRKKTVFSILIIFFLLITIPLTTLLLPKQNTTIPTKAASSLPALPKNWPSGFQIGLADSPNGAAGMKAVAPFGFRYQYLAAGVNTGNGWATWNANGDFAKFYIQDSVNNNIVPVFTYYMMYQSLPGGGTEADADYNNINNTSTMTSYYNDLKMLFQKAALFPNNLVVVHIEPDLWGYLQQKSANDDARTVPAQVATTGLPELAGFPNTVAGFAQAIVKLRDTYAPNVDLAYHLSIWGTGTDIVYADPPDSTVQALATRSAIFYNSLGANFDLTFSEVSDRDAAFKQYQYGDGGAAWWDSGDYSRNILYLTTFVSQTNKRNVIWQIPEGNTKMRAENNTWEHYQDNHVENYLDPGRSYLNSYVNAGVIAFLFGRGADGPTCACDAANDGVTNPAPINGNNLTSLNSDDDGGYLKQKVAAYYNAGVVSLLNGSITPPPPTPPPVNPPPPPVVPPPSTAQNKIGDLNHDGKVDIYDLSILLSQWNQNGNGDLNGSGRVDIYDLSILLSKWGT